MSVLASAALLAAIGASTPDVAWSLTLADSVPMREWTVPWEKSRPRDPYVAPDGRVWFVGQEGNYVAVLDPRSGAFKRYEIEPGTHPHNLIVDKAGMVWYAGNRNGHIGRLDPASGAVTKYPMPEADARDPHTLVFDQAGDIWFTAQNSNYVGRLVVKTGAVRLLRIPTPRARPYGIVIDAAGHPWFNLFGTNTIGTIDPKTFALRTFPLADEKTRNRRIALTPDGKVWYVDYTRGYLGRLDPATGAVKEWACPGAGLSLPYALATDDRGRLWFSETGRQPNRLVGFDPAREQFFSITTVPSGGGTIRHMHFDPKTKLLWFGTDNNTIGRAVVSGERPVL
jgi:virginiamycin B lyase